MPRSFDSWYEFPEETRKDRKNQVYDDENVRQVNLRRKIAHRSNILIVFPMARSSGALQ